MNIAYLILSHKNQTQVETLIDTLSNENVDFFVHIDKKADNFNIKENEHTFVIPPNKRVDIQWATNSMILATIELAHCMLETGRVYDYVFLLSGQDFPIKSNTEIVGFLEDNSGYNFIEVVPHSSSAYKIFIKRNELYYPYFMQKSSMCSKVLKRLYIYLTGGYGHTFGLFKRKKSLNLTFEFGSQWWCLTYECLSWIINYIDNDSELLKFFNNSLVPDECFFQTIFMCSPYREKRHGNLTFLEWSKKNHPRTFVEDDFGLLKSSDCLFARKFDLDVDSKIIELLKSDIAEDKAQK